MPIVRGYNITLGYKEETTEGVMPDGSSGNPITYDYIGHITGFTPTIGVNPIEIRTIGMRMPVTRIRGVRDIGVAKDFYVTNKQILTYAIGNITKTITIWEKINDLNASLMYKGLRANRLRLRGEVGAPLTATMDWIGMDVSTTPPTYAGFGSTPLVEPLHFPDQNVTLGGSALSGRVSAFEVEINNNIEKIYKVGNVVSQTSVEKVLEVSGNITMTFEATSDLNDVLNLTEKTNLVILLGKEGGTTDVTLTIPKMKWTDYPVPKTIGDIIRITLPFSAHASAPTLT
jgi:hypothetical protein